MITRRCFTLVRLLIILLLYSQLENQYHFSTAIATSSTNIPDIVAQRGGIVTRDKNITLTRQFSPIIVTKNIVIKHDARLTVEAGVELLFDKRVGIIVHGTLEILGNPNDKVRLALRNSNLLVSNYQNNDNSRDKTTATGSLAYSSLLRGQQQLQQTPTSARSHQLQQTLHNQLLLNKQTSLRLVDGEAANEGRVQIKLNDRWHSLCTQSKNLTAADINVICRQVGHAEGHLYKWFPKRNETTFQIMSKTFQCQGSEQSIQRCAGWPRHRAGGGVCEHSFDIGIRCSRKFTHSELYWRGIEFVQSDSNQEHILNGVMKQKVSRSRLQHAVISEAGLDEAGNATAAIHVLGQPPRLNEIEIRNSISGLVIENADDAIYLSNMRVLNNLNQAIFVNTSWGKVSMDGLHIENNGGDGVQVVRHERYLVGSHDFCKFANWGTSQSYPVILSHEQQFLTSGTDCCQEFISQNQLTVHFQVLRSTPNNLLADNDSNRRVSVPEGVQIGKEASLIIYDDYRDESPFKLSIRNETRAQSIVSRSGRLKLCYEPALYRTVFFTLVIVADDEQASGPEQFYDTGIAHDLRLSNSLIRRNAGRGLLMDNPRSGLKLLNVTIVEHDYLAGVHVFNGTGEVLLQASQISNNTGSGLHIHLAGGYFHIDNSSIARNSLRGITIHYDKRPELVAFNHTMHLSYSLVAANGEHGLFVGNVCRSDAFWNISMNSFVGNGDDAISFESCLATRDTLANFANLTSRQANPLQVAGDTGEQHSHARSLGALGQLQELLVTHNRFQANARRALRMAPVFFVKCHIKHNLFREHPLAVIYINNQAFEHQLANVSWLAPASVRLSSNRFYSNRGRYVANLGLLEEAPKQQLSFTKNYLEFNHISEPYAELRPRSRVSAVLVVSSSNVKVIQNKFDNPQSDYELGSHLEAHARLINATANFWGHGLDAVKVYRRIFDRKNRYNLAQVEFIRYLLTPDDLEYKSDLSFEQERDKFPVFRNGTKLGGELKGFEELAPDTYTVVDDLFVRPGAHLILRPNTVLKFLDGVGMMVQGRLDALGQANGQILLTSASASNRLVQLQHHWLTTSSTTPAPAANAWVSYQSEELQQELPASDLAPANHSRQGVRVKRQTPAAPVPSSHPSVRLSHVTMGRVEVQIEGIWGSVCDYQFDIDDAAVICQQLGMILNRDDWLLERYQYAADEHQLASIMTNEALMTNLRCDPTLDSDVTACKAEVSLRGDFDGTCNSEVGIRCFPPSWSGLRFGMGAETSILEHLTVQRAGMFDYATFALKPALQIDFNRHSISNIVVKSNSDSGLGILWNDVIGRHFNELFIQSSKFINNERHGIELRSRGLTIRGCTLSNNRRSGLDYNPSFSQKEMAELLSWLRTARNQDNIVTISFPLKVDFFSVPSAESSFRFFVIEREPRANIMDNFTIGTDQGHMLSVMLLNPIHPESSEQLNMTLGSNPESPIWNYRHNTTSFPMVSPGYKFHFNYSSGPSPRGNIVLYIRSRFNNRDLRALARHVPTHLVMAKFDQTANNINSRLINALVLTNCTVARNGIGLKFKHPSYSLGPQSSFNRRYCNETANITSSSFESNFFSSILISSDEYELSYDDANRFGSTASSEIRYSIAGNKFRRNKDGLRQFSRDISRAHNIFHWNIEQNVFDSNRGGGINLMLPYFWRYDTNLSHTIEINNNSFLKNVHFELAIGGHFAMFNLTHNELRENRCRNKLISIGGMEKRAIIKFNAIEQNTCNRLFDFGITSHADKLGSLASEFKFNSLRFNRRAILNSTYINLVSNFKYPHLLSKLHPEATDYALALRGLQALNITRNLFANPELRFELMLALVLDSSEHRAVNAMENYWNSLEASEIQDRIFDFDDWNNFALVELSPILVRDSFEAATMLIEPAPQLSQASALGLRSLGGRLHRPLTLGARREPYLIESDLTIMPSARLTIERGAVLEFMPNVGILVLGELVASGTAQEPIEMRPLLSALDMQPLRSYLYPAKTRPNITLSNLMNDPQSYEHNYAYRHYHFSYPIDLGSARLCKNEICHDGLHLYDNNVEDSSLRRQALQDLSGGGGPDGLAGGRSKMDGFLEVFNMTTLQWVPVCDPLFTEHTARVVCQQFGLTGLSLFRRGRRYTIEPEQLASVKHWPESVSCDGDESSLASCPLAATGFMNHSTSCERDSNQFVYVYCRNFGAGVSARPPASQPGLDAQEERGASNQQRQHEHLHHWAGIRFACPARSTAPSWQDVPLVGSMQLAAGQPSQRAQAGPKSRLQHVRLDQAGALHRRRAPALQVLQCNVQMEYLTVSNSAHHAIEIITSHGNQNFHQLRLLNNLGLGLNYLSLTGSSSATRLVPYLPLKQLDYSSDIRGLIDICAASKELRIDERLLLFYRYSSRPADCVKIVSSKLSVKHIGVRLLQFNLFNSSSYTSRPDSLRIYDGNIFERDSRLLADIGVTERHRLERPELKFYQSSDSSITLRLHASGAGPYNGFIAELVTTPVSYNIQRDLYNNFTYSQMSNNKLGAVVVSSAGESTTNLIFKNNRFESNCLNLFGNFSSCLNTIYMELQNCQRLRMINNLFKSNQGGLLIKSYSHTAVSALEAAIENNVWEANENLNQLALLGPRTDPYQTVRVVQNYFTRNSARFASNIILSRIVANFSSNLLTANTGRHQIEVVGFDKLPLSYQTFAHNWIYNNSATYERDQSTIFGNSAGQQYYMNYLVNPDNHFELSTMNWSRYDVRPYQVLRDDEIIHLLAGDGSSKDLFRKTVDSIPLNVIESKRINLYYTSINAKHNWWGFNSSAAIQGRIRDHSQHDELIKVDFLPFLQSNSSLLSGICAAGWQRVGQACLVHVGTRMSYLEAQQFCDQERATLPLLRGNHEELTEFVRLQQRGDFDARIERIWVRSFDVSRHACPAINDYRTKSFDCRDSYSFICERDPEIVVTLLHWHYETGGVIAFVLSLITMILTCCCSACWLYKSRRKRKENFERRNSIKVAASMRSSRASGLNGPGALSFAASNSSLSEFFLHRQLYTTDNLAEKTSNSDLSLSTQLTHPSASVPQDAQQPAGDRNGIAARRHLAARLSSSDASSRLQRPAKLTRPAPASPKQPLYLAEHYSPGELAAARQVTSYTAQPVYTNTSTPTLLAGAAGGGGGSVRGASGSSNARQSPSDLGAYLADETFMVAPSAPLRFSSSSSRPTASKSSSSGSSGQPVLAPVKRATQGVQMHPMPDQRAQSTFRVAPASQPPPPPPALGYQYSNVMLNNDQNHLYQNSARIIRSLSAGMSDSSAGSSSAPTNYSNNTFDESTNSYLETYNVYQEAYGNANTLMVHTDQQQQQQFNHSRQHSYDDLLMSKQSQRMISSQSEDSSQADLLSSLVDPNSEIGTNLNQLEIGPPLMNVPDRRRDAVDRHSRSSSQYWIETSLDHLASSSSHEQQQQQLVNDFNATSQEQHQLSAQSVEDRMHQWPFDAQLEQAPKQRRPSSSPPPPPRPLSSDSKSGSRVYLETSFE